MHAQSEFRGNSVQSFLSLIENISANSEHFLGRNIPLDSDYDTDYGYVVKFFCFENFQPNLSKKQHNPYMPSCDRQSCETSVKESGSLPRITATAPSNMISCRVHKPAILVTTLFSVESCIADSRLWVHKPDYIS